MSTLPIEITSESVRIDVTGPDWLVDLGWWLKDGGDKTVDHLSGVVGEVVGVITDAWCLGAAFSVITLLSILIERRGLEVEMARYASAHGEGRAVGTAKPTIE